jgi:hypothetical protein
MSKSSHKFEENILKLSETNEVDKLHEEWVCLGYDERVINSETCICNKEIGNVYRFLNMKTMKMINVGTNCVKKLQLKKCKSVRLIMSSFIGGVRGNYNQICDLIKYSNQNWLAFLDAIKTRVNSDWDNLIGLTEINKIMAILSENGVECTELHMIVDAIKKRLDERAQLAETHRIFTEKVAKHAELERIRIYKERIRQRRLQDKLQEEEKVRIQKLQREERDRKRSLELERLLEENLQKERDRIFQDKKAEFGKDIREQVRERIERCEKCNIIQRCLQCSSKITKEVNRIIVEMINSDSM